MDTKRLFDLSGRVAIVTGGAGGIGKALALGLADAGADIVVASRTKGKLDEVASQIESMGRKSLAVPVDTTDEAQVENMVKEVLKVFPTIDILVNTAGLAIRKPAEDFPIEEWQQVMNVNVRGTFLPCKHVGKVMIERGKGKIINTSSVRGQYGLPRDYAAYSTSKGAIDTLTKTLACEWAKFNVQVNAFAPTIVETDLTASALANPDYAKMMRSRIPMGRWAMPDDLVGLVIYFASDASNFVTGQVVYCDGGVTTW
jgi:NAD(P)-dependent dehydrogenase (short-subunit alcohol dehydrogenase family)